MVRKYLDNTPVSPKASAIVIGSGPPAAATIPGGYRRIPDVDAAALWARNGAKSSLKMKRKHLMGGNDATPHGPVSVSLVARDRAECR